MPGVSWLHGSGATHMHVSVGGLRLEPGTNRLRLLWYGALAYLQARRADGVIHASVYREDGRTSWSLSVWDSREAMLAYRNYGSHLRRSKCSTFNQRAIHLFGNPF